MTSKHPNADPSPPMTGFDDIRRSIDEQKGILREGVPEDYPMGIDEHNLLSCTASQGILKLLEEQGIERASTLAAKLAEDAYQSEEADIGTVADEYETARLAENDEGKRNELERLSKLARVVAETTRVAVEATLGGGQLSQALHDARESMVSHGAYIGAEATDIIDGLLNDMQVAGRPEDHTSPN